MDADEFRKRGREMVDYIADYMTQIRSRRVTPEVEPGYLRKLLPPSAPKKGENWDDIMKDIEGAIMPGITHWQHPNFHAYFPAGNSFPSILGDMLSDAIGCIGFSWAASPACTELETLVLDWMGKMIGLPKQFLHSSGEGGGVIQGSASESVLVALLSARHRAIKQVKERQPYIEEGQLLSRLVGYCSKLSHSCVEKAGMIGCVKMRHLDVDENFSLRGHVLEDAIEEDKKLGLIPFFVCATLGTTACCSFDNLAEIGEVATRHGIYLHVDAAYAGNALICPEFHYIKEGVENVDSFSFNTNKWLQVNFDCSLMWVRSVDDLTTALTVDPLYLQHKHGDKAIDLRHWGIPLSRRFRALKLWFVIRTYGIEGLQQRIREHCRLAKLFEAEVLSDDRFEVLGDVTMGLVCFRLQGPNSRTQKLLKMINDSGKLHMVPAMLNEHYIIRFALCTEYACDEDITYAWKVVTSAASELLQGRKRCDSNKEKGTLYDLSDYIGDEDTFAAFDEEIIFDNQREHLQKSQVMRNCFFKMVSDPKCYNPRVLRSLSRQVATQRDERLDRRNVENLRAEDKENSMPKSELQVNFVKDKSQKDTAVAGPREGSRRKSVQFKKNSFISSESRSSFEDDEINSVENIPPQAKGEKTADSRNKIKIMTNSNNSQQGTSLRSTVVDYKTSSREELQKKGQDDGTERRRKIADDSGVKEKQQKMTSSNKEINYKFADNINESDDDAELARRKTNFGVQTQTKPPIAKRMRQNGITEKGLRTTEKCDGKPAMTTGNDDGHIGMDMKSMIALEKTVCRSDEATETSFDSPDPDGLDEGIVLEDRAGDRDGTSHWGQSQENEEDETGNEDIITMA